MLAKFIVRSLSNTFEKSWQFREVPENWKKVIIIPIFKREEGSRNYSKTQL